MTLLFAILFILIKFTADTFEVVEFPPNVPHPSVKEGKFHVYAISSLDEGIEILTGVPAGKKNKDGKYPAGTIKYLAYEKLKQYEQQYHAFVMRHSGLIY